MPEANPPQTLFVVDLAIVIAYLIGTLAVGLWFMRKATTVEDVTVGNRAMPGWALGLSILGTYFSSISFLALPGGAYGKNWNAFVFSLSIPLVCVMAHYWFVPMYRKTIQTTAYEHLEHRFGYWARAFSGGSLVALQVIRGGIVLYLLALASAPLLGWKIETVILVLGVLTIVYTVLGGFEAVIWTDVVQTVVFIVGALACCGLLIARTDGGLSGITGPSWDKGLLGLGGWEFDLTRPTFWVILVYGLFENVKNFGIDQNYVQRFISAKSDREARKSMWLGAITYIPVSAMFIFIGTALFARYGYGAKEGLPAGFPEAGDAVFPWFIVHGMPVGMTGIIIAALLAAGMSTLSSNINTSATVWVSDFYRRAINPEADDHRQLMVTRGASLLIGVVATGSGLYMMAGGIQQKSVLDVWWGLSSILGGGMIGLFLLGALVKSATRRGAMIAVGVGMIVVVWGAATQGYPPEEAKAWYFPWHKNLIGIVSAAVILLVGWLEAAMFGRRIEPARD